MGRSTRNRSDTLFARLLVIVWLIAACASPAAPPTTVAPSAEPSRPASTPVVSTAGPTADLAHPVGVIAIGHSGLTGEGTAGTYEANPSASWATGDDPAVQSIYSRLVAVVPETAGHVANTARGGAGAALLWGQALSAMRQVAAPRLAIVQTVDNDILCDASNVKDVGASLAEALDAIHQASPNTTILVVGQAGRPSVKFVTELVNAHPEQQASLTWGDPCSFYDADGKLSPSGFEKLTTAIDAYEAETARVCALVDNCFTDGGVRRTWVDKQELFSSDFAHFNVAGQAAVAAQMWPVVEKALGLR